MCGLAGANNKSAASHAARHAGPENWKPRPGHRSLNRTADGVTISAACRARHLPGEGSGPSRKRISSGATRPHRGGVHECLRRLNCRYVVGKPLEMVSPAARILCQMEFLANNTGEPRQHRGQSLVTYHAPKIGRLLLRLARHNH